MTGRPYRVFLSAASLDLKSFRQAAAETLNQHAARICKHGPLEVVSQEEFPPDYQTVWEILRQRILQCDAVICLVGYAYGREPRNVPLGFRRRSYTQMEFDIARALGKPVFLFRADDPSALDRHEPEELRGLQDQFRDELRQLDQVRETFKTKEELLARLEKLELPPPSPRKPVNLPYTSIGTLFKGRDAFLKALREKLGAAPGRAVGVVARQAIHGLGGVGKTRLAMEYAWQNEADYTALLFVLADTPANLRRTLAELVGPLVLDLKEVQDVKEEEPRFAAAVRWLESHPGWFLILDNVDSEEAAREAMALLPRLQRGHVVITSRLSKWRREVQPLELDVLDVGPAREFLLEKTAADRLPTATDAADARSLAEALDGLALALEQAGAYINEQRCSLAEYLDRWRKQEEDVLAWSDDLLMTYPRSVAVTWETTWAQLSPAARVLLEILSWFAPDPIPQWVLDGEATRPIATQALGASPGRAVADLEKYSMLKRHVRVDGWGLLVHRLVQELTRLRLGADGRRPRLEHALELADAVAVGDPQDVRTWPVWDALAPHGRVLVAYADEAGIAEPTARLMNALGTHSYSKALYAEAEPLMRRTLAIAEGSYGPDHPTVAIRLNNLAELLRNTNRLDEAEPLMRRTLAIAEGSYGPDHPTVAIRLNNLAELLRNTNRLDEAEPLMRRALAIAEGSYGPDHPDVAIRLNNLAELLRNTNRLDEAEPLMRRALAIAERSYGPDHPDVATDLNNLAQLLQDTNRLGEAEPLMRRALAIDEGSYGPDHPRVATDLNNLAGLLQDTDRLGEAEPLYRRALAIAERSYGPDHPTVATDLSNLALLLQATNRLDEAEPLIRRALGISERSYGPDHPTVATGLNNLAGLLQDTNRLDEAEPLMRRALAIDEWSYGPDHPTVATGLNNLALLLQDTNRLDEAEPLMRRALGISERSYGPDHPTVAIRLSNLALLLQATNRLDEAEPLYRRALAIDEGSYGPDHPRVATDLNNLAALLQATNRLDEAEPLYRRALAIDEGSYGPDHPTVAIDLNNLAGLLQDTNRLDEAEPLYRRALAIDEGSYGPDHPRVATGLNNLAGLLQDTNRLDEAEPLYRRALAIDEGSYGPDHPRVATDLNNLAALLQATNRLDEAEPLYRRALAIDEQSYGPDHPRVATDLNNLAALLQATNRLDEAEPLYRRALAIDEQSYGPDHPRVAIDLNNLAGLLQDTNRLDEAEPLYRRALAIDEGSYGPDHPTVAIRLNNLALLLTATNRLDEAEPLSRRHLEIFLKFTSATGHEHPHLRDAIENYGVLLEELGLSEGEIARRLAEAAGARGGGRPAAPRPRRRHRIARRPTRPRRGPPPAAGEGEGT